MKIPYAVAKHRLIYVFGSPDASHRGFLKIGETTVTTDLPADKLKPNCTELNRAAVARINQYMKTAGVSFRLLHTELAVDNKNNAFRDRDVHRLLKKSGVTQGDIGREWFQLDLSTARRAIDAVKLGKKFLAGIKPKTFREEIILRPEQQNAVDKTVEHFKHGGKTFLWNAKMRFGKTLCALAVVREMNFAKTIIVTHRPVVNAGWYEDFNKIFGGNDGFSYGSKFKDISLADLRAGKKNFVYFASMQDLRGSQAVNNRSTDDKNREVFNEKWDFVIVDEAHEGTQTILGDAVIKALVKRKSKFLALSGTPFNLLDDFGDDNVFTWDYVMEQRAKAAWDKNFPCDSNPYAELPQMNIFTYNLGELSQYVDPNDMSFSFREFFKTDDNERFVYERDVISFLNLLAMESDNNYPFSRLEFRNMFKHTLWIVPGVKEGRALSALMDRLPAYCAFKIVNVAGNGNSDDEPANALDKVRNAIDKWRYTITLSCGKLTIGVTVPEWTAVLYLAGGYNTSAQTYLQTIFRVQSPCNKGGVSKQNCYVFDFAPDRALRVVADSVKASTRAGQTTDRQRRALGELLNFCPVIAVKGSEMKNFDTAAKLLQRIKRVQAERIVNNGFEDSNLYNHTLFDITEDEWKDFQQLGHFVGKSKSSKKAGEIIITDTGLTNEQREVTKRKFYTSRTEQEKELDKKRRRRLDAIKALNGVSVRIPMLIYGADIDLNEDITVEKFLELVDDASWEEFMPKGVTKDFFRKFIRHYDIENFINAGHDVRKRAKAADDLTPTARVKKIAALFATFKNPDKETVLTPWRVVNLHLASVFGGCFFDDSDKPCRIHSDVFTPESKILEINSKTGLYPLYVAYSIYRARLEAKNLVEGNTPLKELHRLWDLTVANNVFALCKTPMAEKITQRTLRGYRQGNVNAKFFPDLIDTLKNTPQVFLNQITNAQFWSKGVGKMFFDAVVGNPPYQSTTSTGNFNPPIYHLFLKTAFNLADRVSLIHPARCLFNAGATPKEFNQEMLCDKHIKIVRYFPDSTKYISDEGSEKKLFPDSDIKGGIVITLRDANQNFGAIGTFIPFEELRGIHQKVCVDNPNFQPLSDIVFSKTIYRLTKKFHDDNPAAIKIISEGHANDFATSLIETFTDLFFDEKPDDGREYIQAYGRLNNVRVCKYFRRDWVNNPTPLEKWKVLVPESNGSGALGEVLVTPLVGSPLVGHTETFITVGAFATRAEAQACIAYIKTRFCRAMLGILKVTQHNPPATWAKVPLQDFTLASDIDWSLSVSELDERLFDKYGLTAAEREFILSHVKEME